MRVETVLSTRRISDYPELVNLYRRLEGRSESDFCPAHEYSCLLIFMVHLCLLIVCRGEKRSEKEERATYGSEVRRSEE